MPPPGTRPRPELRHEIMEFLLGHNCPGNLTQLQTAINTLVAIGDESSGSRQLSMPGYTCISRLSSEEDSMLSRAFLMCSKWGCPCKVSSRGSARVWKDHGHRAASAPSSSAIASSVAPNAANAAAVNERSK